MKTSVYYLRSLAALLPTWFWVMDLRRASAFAGILIVLYSFTMLLVKATYRFQAKRWFSWLLISWVTLSVFSGVYFLHWPVMIGVSLWLLLPISLQANHSDALCSIENLSIGEITTQAFWFLCVFLGAIGALLLLREQVSFSFFGHPAGFFILLFFISWVIHMFQARREKNYRGSLS